ncbi:MAG TPA: response regulator [Candidatus Binatia bacterium]|nr:response regulator [Candidatus Binatia bacterium]
MEAQSAAKNSNPFHILIIDDNRDFVEFLNLLLSHDGFDVRWAYNGPEGLEQLRQHPVDLVILDVMMPKMDGLAVCRELRNSHPTLPVILLTAKDDMATRTEAIKLGVCEFLAKPVNIEDLMTRVRTQCQICQWDKNLLGVTGEQK